ncbi:MAG TPA: translocation/assembly module TamB domain-containing protein [Blastocatellia bacterium]
MNRFIAAQVQSALADFGVRTDIGSFELSWGPRSAVVRNVKFYNQATGQLLASVDRAKMIVSIPDLYSLKLRREIIFDRLEVSNLEAYVQIDPHGLSNLQGLHQPPPSAPGRLTFDFSRLGVSLTQGTLHLTDQSDKVDANIGNIQATAQPVAGTANEQVKFTAGPGQVTYEGRPESFDGLEVDGVAGDSGADIQTLTLHSPVAQLAASGHVTNWTGPKYDASLKASASLPELTRLLALNQDLAGSVSFQGQADGEGAQYHVTGGVTSDDLAAAGTRVLGLKIDKIEAQSDGKRLTFANNETSARSVTISGAGGSGHRGSGNIELANVRAAGIRGVMEDGHTQGTLQELTVQGVALPNGKISGASLRQVEARLQDGRYQASGNLQVNGADIQDIQVGALTGKVQANNTSVALNQFATSILGGKASGDFVMQLGRGGNSHLDAKITGVSTDELYKAFAAEGVALSGTVDAQASVTWPGTDVSALSGDLTATLTGQTTATATAIPVNGQVSIKADGGSFNVDQLDLQTPASKLTATGALSHNGDSQLRFSVTSTHAEELQTIVESIDDIEKDIADYKPALSGNLSLTGGVTGKLSDPSIETDVSIDSVGLHDQALGKVTGHVALTPTDVSVQSGLLAAVDGGSIKFSYESPREPTATTGHLDATIDNIKVDTITAAAGVENQTVVTGAVSGEAHLTGLPDSPTGTATVNLLNATIANEQAQSATASIVFDGKTVRTDNATIKTAKGQLTASGSLELKSGDFQAKGSLVNLDLGDLAASIKNNVIIAGTANANVQASGNTKDLSQLKVDLKAEGANVTVNGRQAGALELTATTNAAGRLDVNLTTGISGNNESLRASVELRSPGKPVTADADFTDLDASSIISFFNPDLANTLAAKLTGRIHVAGPLEDSSGNISPDGLDGDLVLNAASIQLQDQPVTLQMPFTIALNHSEVTLRQTHINGDGLDITAGGSLALTKEGRMDFTVKGSTDLSHFSLPDQDLTFGGTIALNAHLTGTLSEPNLTGDVQMTNLAFNGGETPVAISDGNGRLVLTSDKATLDNFTAKANDGTAKASGSVTLKNLVPRDWKFTITATNVDLYYQDVQAIINGDLALQGDQQHQEVTGTLTVPEADYVKNFTASTFTGGGGGGISLSNAAEETTSEGLGLPPLHLNISVSAPSTFLIRNDLVNTVASAALHLGGTIDSPSISGHVNLEGGTIKLAGQRYYITTGTLDFPIGGDPPEVNLMTEADISTYHLNVGLHGPVNDMEVELRSDPTLARSDVLSLIATGQVSNNTLNSQQVAASGAGAVGSLLSQSLLSQPAQSLLGLNRFELDPVLEANTDPAARLTAGKQITRDLQFTYSTDLSSQQSQTIIVEYDLTTKYSAIASYTQGGEINNGVRTDNDFTIEVRARQGYSLGYGHEAAVADRSKSLLPGAGGKTMVKANVDVERPEGIKLSNRRLKHLLPVEEQGFSRALEILGERNLVNYLQDEGYFLATVTSKCDPADCTGTPVKIVYNVSPGDRYRLDAVRIEGTDQIKYKEVSGDLESKPADFLGGLPVFRTLPLIGGLARGVTSNSDIRGDRETIQAKMADLGFRSAHVDSKLVPNKGNQTAELVFTVKDGPRSTVAEVQFNGNQVMSAADLTKLVPIKAGKPFSPGLAGKGAQDIRTNYANQGFLEAKALYRIVDVEPNKVRLIYDVAEGTRSIVTQIAINGQTKTRVGSIGRFLDFKAGDILTPDEIRRTERALYSTGAFSEVEIHHTPVPGSEDDRATQANIQVTESKPLIFVYGVGYSTGEGPEGLIELTDANLFGRVDSASVRFRVSRVEQFGQFQYTNLRTLGSKWDTTVSLFYDRNTDLATFVQPRLVGGGSVSATSIPGFGIDRLAAFIQAERKLTARTSFRLRYNFENARLVNTQDIPLEEIAPGEQSVRLGMITAGFTHDSRNSALNPTDGQLISVDHSIALSQLGGNVSFNKFFGQYQRYHQLPKKFPVLKDSVLAFAGRIGLSAPFDVGKGPLTEAQTELPIPERFFAGGPTTLRGFEFDQAGPQGILEPQNATELPTLVPVGGNALMIYNFELRYPLTKIFWLVPFFDYGNVFAHNSDISFNGMSRTVGMGFRINTPIGPVGVDYGYLLNPPSFISAQGIILKQPQGVINIRFGETF